MANRFKVGVAGLTHGHVGGLIRSFKEAPGSVLVSVADGTGLLGQYKDDFQTSYKSWREMIEKEELDGLVVTSNNVESTEIAVAALEKGIPCLVEKAMAANAADADKMLSAMRKSGKTLMINWPLAWSAPLHEAVRRIHEGQIGPVFHLRYRNGHKGPREIGCGPEFVAWLYDEKLNGGGAIADFCSYGAVLCRWILGMPQSVYCVRGNYTKGYKISDDHAICALKYPKASALIEGTWATNGFDDSENPVFHGKDGTLSTRDKDVVLSVSGQDRIREMAPPLAIGSPAVYFMECIRHRKKPEGILNPEIAADACRILDAAIKSSKSGCSEAP